jgi:hypothetical protein
MSVPDMEINNTLAEGLRYLQLGWRLCLLRPQSKAPFLHEWNDKLRVISTPEQLTEALTRYPNAGLGLVHEHSQTGAIDIDHLEYCALLFKHEMGIDFAEVFDGYPRIKSRDGRDKYVFRVPEGFEGTTRKINWPHPEADPNSPDAAIRNKRVVLLEFRHKGAQDALPPTIHPDTLQPYSWIIQPVADIPLIPPAIAAIWLNFNDFKPQFEASCPWSTEKPKAPPSPKRQVHSGGESVIDRFNKTYDTAGLLESYGYQRKGKRWLAPSSSTGIPGVVVLAESGKCYSHHASDPLNDGHSHDAFDVFCILEMGNSFNEAISIARSRLDMSDAEIPEIDISELLKNSKKQKHQIAKASSKPNFIGDINNPRPKILNSLPVAELQAAADWFDALSNKPHPDASMLSAIALGCVLTGRKYVSAQENHPSLQLVMSGGSYIGKNYGKTGISRLLGASGLSHLMSNEFYTHRSAIYTALSGAPNHICITDEFGECFMEARKSSSGNLNTVFKGLKSTYSDAGDYFRGSAYADPTNKKQPIANPSLTLLGLTTPEQFFGEITEHQVKGGTFNRFLVVNLNRTLLQERQSITRKPPPTALVDWIKSMRELSDSASDAMPFELPALREIPFTQEAEKVFSDFWDYVDAQEEKLGEAGQDSLVGRWRENAMRMSTMFAACRSSREGGKVIDEGLAIFSCAFVRYHGLETIYQLSGQLSDQDSYWSKVVKIGAYIREAGLDGRTRSDIIRKFRIKTRDLEEIFNTLAITEGMVKKVANPTGFAGTGRKAESYVITGVILSDD